MLLQTDEAKVAIENEALLTLLMQHPNLLQGYALVLDDAGKSTGFAMEYLEGGDLHAAIQ